IQYASIRNSNIRKFANVMPGLRTMRQDPVENVFSFICSSNNNIARITQMVHNLKRVYGREISHEGLGMCQPEL
ncbi:hypothetical protein SARC_11166, partial [Sphaeroforma arctica JP610]